MDKIIKLLNNIKVLAVSWFLFSSVNHLYYQFEKIRKRGNPRF